MYNKGKWKSFTVSDIINTLVQADAHIGTHAELASHLIFSVSMLNTTVNNIKQTEQSYTQCGPFSKEQKH
jgi:hypothetical protein